MENKENQAQPETPKETPPTVTPEVKLETTPQPNLKEELEKAHKEIEQQRYTLAKLDKERKSLKDRLKEFVPDDEGLTKETLSEIFDEKLSDFALKLQKENEDKFARIQKERDEALHALKAKESVVNDSGAGSPLKETLPPEIPTEPEQVLLRRYPNLTLEDLRRGEFKPKKG